MSCKFFSLFSAYVLILWHTEE